MIAIIQKAVPGDAVVIVKLPICVSSAVKSIHLFYPTNNRLQMKVSCMKNRKLINCSSLWIFFQHSDKFVKRFDFELGRPAESHLCYFIFSSSHYTRIVYIFFFRISQGFEHLIIKAIVITSVINRAVEHGELILKNQYTVLLSP